MATQVSAPLVVVIGPTASGKSAVAMELAERYGGEIICADSRTVYKGLDVGTAKPTAEERRRVTHHLLDVVQPNEPFSVADFQYLVNKAISEIRERGRTPILVGGTGLYIDSVVFNYTFSTPVNDALRQKLQEKTVEQLQKKCEENNIEIPENFKNKRYLIRAIEQKGLNKQRRTAPVDNCIIVGLSTDRDKLEQKIRTRIEHMFDNDVVNEAAIIASQYGWDSEAMKGNIYRVARNVIEKGISRQEAIKQAITLDKRLAKRQMTWFKRNKFIHWLAKNEVAAYVEAELTKTVAPKHDKIENK